VSKDFAVDHVKVFSLARSGATSAIISEAYARVQMPLSRLRYDDSCGSIPSGNQEAYCLAGDAMPPRIRSDVTVQHVGDESLVLDLKSNQIHQLNATATWILAQCNGEKSMESITNDFAACFSLDAETAASDVSTTIEQLHQAKVIDLD